MILQVQEAQPLCLWVRVRFVLDGFPETGISLILESMPGGFIHDGVSADVEALPAYFSAIERFRSTCLFIFLVGVCPSHR